MTKKITDYTRAIQILQHLKKEYPTYMLGQHIATVLADYGDIWGITDREFVFALEKYMVELEYNITPDDEVDKIVRDAQDLSKLLSEEEEEDDSYDS